MGRARRPQPGSNLTVLSTVSTAHRSRSPFCAGMRVSRTSPRLSAPTCSAAYLPHACSKGCSYLLFSTGSDSVGFLHLRVSRDAPPKCVGPSNTPYATLGFGRVLSILLQFVFGVLSSVRCREVCELVRDV